jgi:hypothetical protein
MIAAGMPRKTRPTKAAKPRGDHPQAPQLLPPGRPLTAAHKALIALFAEIAVAQYLLEG